MQIYSVEDQEFNHLLSSFAEGKAVGKYWNNGQLQVVKASSQYMMVSPDQVPSKLAVKAAKSFSEAERLALRLLTKERERGNQVEFASEYKQ